MKRIRQNNNWLRIALDQANIQQPATEPESIESAFQQFLAKLPFDPSQVDMSKSLEENYERLALPQELPRMLAELNDPEGEKESPYVPIVNALTNALKKIQIESQGAFANSYENMLKQNAPYCETAQQVQALDRNTAYIRIPNKFGDYRTSHIALSAFFALYSPNISTVDLEWIFNQWQTDGTIDLRFNYNRNKTLYFLTFLATHGPDFKVIEDILVDINNSEPAAYQKRLYFICLNVGFQAKAGSFFLALMGDPASPCLDVHAYKHMLNNGIIKMDGWRNTKELDNEESEISKLIAHRASLKKDLKKLETAVKRSKQTGTTNFFLEEQFSTTKQQLAQLSRQITRRSNILSQARQTNTSIAGKLFKSVSISRFKEGIAADVAKIERYWDYQGKAFNNSTDAQWDFYAPTYRKNPDKGVSDWLHEVFFKWLKSNLPENHPALDVNNHNDALQELRDNREYFRQEYVQSPEYQEWLSSPDRLDYWRNRAFKRKQKEFEPFDETQSGDNEAVMASGFAKFYKLALKAEASGNTMIPNEYRSVIEDINQKCQQVGLRAYAVGGFVRDMQLGKKPKDLDIMVDVVDQSLYFPAIQPYVEEAQNDPNFIRSRISAPDKNWKLVQIGPARVEQSSHRPEFFRVTADVTWDVTVYNQETKQREVQRVVREFETSVNPSLLLAKQYGKSIPRGEAFGIYAISSPVGEIEIAYPRTESYEEGSRKPRTEMGTLDEDAKRRDFGMNALFLDLETNELLDPTGHGLQDIEEGVVRVSDPSSIDTIFRDDPLRILRAIRQAAQHNLQIDPQILEYVKAHPYLLSMKGESTSNGWEAKLSAERIAEEIRKIMSLRNAPQSMRLLKDLGLVDYVFPRPQGAQDWNFDQKNPHHHLDVWEHIMSVMEHMQDVIDETRPDMQPDQRFILNMSALLHDIGKLVPEKGYQELMDEAGNLIKRRFHGHAEQSVEITRQILNRLRFSKDELNKIVNLVKHHDNVYDFDPGRKDRNSDPTGDRRGEFDKFYDTPKFKKKLADMVKELGDQIYDLIILSRGDRKGHAPGSDSDEFLTNLNTYLTPEKYQQVRTNLQPLLNGNDIMNIAARGGSPMKPGPQLRELLDKLVEAQVVGQVTDRQQAEDFIKKLVIKPALNGTELQEIAKSVGYNLAPGPQIGQLIRSLVERQFAGQITSKEQAIEFMRQTFQGMTTPTPFADINNSVIASSTTAYWYKIAAPESQEIVNPGGGKNSKKRKDKPSQARQRFDESSTSVFRSMDYTPQMNDYNQEMSGFASVKQAQAGDFVGNPLNNARNYNPSKNPNDREAVQEQQVEQKAKESDEEYPEYVLIARVPLDTHLSPDPKLRDMQCICYYQSEKTQKYMVKAPIDGKIQRIWGGKDLIGVIRIVKEKVSTGQIAATGYGKQDEQTAEDPGYIQQIKDNAPIVNG